MASKRSADGDEGATTMTIENPSTVQAPKNKRRKKKGKSKKNKKNNHVKDPKEAHNYLTTWKNKDAAPGVWKFNKNTQSWLIRKMYDAEMIPKAIFAILMEYLAGLHGKETIDRIYQDALRRILRYKEWEKKSDVNGDGDVDENKNGNGDNEKDGENEPAEDKTTTTDNDNNDDDDDNDEDRFQKLNAHDKRKEYKRARKVHDVIKAVTERTESAE